MSPLLAALTAALSAGLLAQAQPPSPPAQPIAPIPLAPRPMAPPSAPQQVAPSRPRAARPPGGEGASDVVTLRPQDGHERPFLSRAADAIAGAARRLWQREEPHAAAGNAKAAAGDTDGALAEYDESEKKLPPGDGQAALAFDRSGALLKGPPEAAPKALEQALKAQESSDKSLRSKAAYNAALALEAAGKTDEAIKAYGQSLALDPDDVDSKVNLELLLRTEEQKKQQAAGPQDPDAKKKPQDQKDKQQQKAQGEKKQDEPQKKKPGEDEKKEEQKQEQAQQKPQDKPEDKKKEEQKQAQAEQQEQKQEQPQDQLGRSEAQRLLDAARAGEKNLQAWRFGKRTDQRKKHSAEKDW